MVEESKAAARTRERSNSVDFVGVAGEGFWGHAARARVASGERLALFSGGSHGSSILRRAATCGWGGAIALVGALALRPPATCAPSLASASAAANSHELWIPSPNWACPHVPLWRFAAGSLAKRAALLLRDAGAQGDYWPRAQTVVPGATVHR
ncbi:uncharacterized protein BXZ73DRAFT_102251 [Epithele typhae]|uniref:uncharacterized protein n=1 Tax=Epithele typhae TaxID=378194 RepID=UPI0020080AE2|nr:uncharacterized protein BXZ73DRAFT_102251 [Epithele typhae]KAH9929097.1 hypothetical protein BXZ73DRAFT_102251 [Epithele typhae]